MDISKAPVIASHSNSRAICNHSRNITDDMFRAICQTGGVVGINLYADFLGINPTLNMVADHILHLLEIDPMGEHIALGGDLDGCDSLPSDFQGIQDYPLLAKLLLEQGVGPKIVKNIFWNNALGVFQNALCINKG